MFRECVVFILALGLLCSSALREQRATDTRSAKDCGTNPADIVFVLDESGSIWGEDFTRQLNFVKGVVKQFHVSTKTIRVAVMTFASKVRFIFHLGQINSYNKIAAVVSKIRQTRGGTLTGDALAFMRNTTFAKPHVRPEVPHVAIVVTDGASQQKVETLRQAKLAKDAGIAIFAIGVGRKVNKTELHLIASKPLNTYVSTVNDYKALDSLKQKLASKACRVTTKPPPVTTTPKPTPTPVPMIEGCTGKIPVDVVFALPSQLGIQETLDSKDFMRAIVKGTEVGPTQVQIGVAKHICDPHKEIYLKQYDNNISLQGGLDALRRGAKTDQIVRHMRAVSFNPTSGARKKASKIGILILNNKSADLRKTLAEVLLAKQEMQLIVIGVGKKADPVEVSALSTTQKYSFFAKDFEDLITLKAAILNRICKAIQPPINCLPQGKIH